MKMLEFRLRFHWSLFLRVQLTIFQHWFRKWLGADKVTNHYLNQWWLVYRRVYASLCLNELSTSVVDTGIWFSIKMSYQFRKSHCGDTVVIGSSYLHSETSYTGPSGTKFNEILIEIHTFSFKKMHLKMSSVKWQPFCLGLCVKTQWVKGNPRGFWTEAWV